MTRFCCSFSIEHASLERIVSEVRREGERIAPMKGTERYSLARFTTGASASSLPIIDLPTERMKDGEGMNES